MECQAEVACSMQRNWQHGIEEEKDILKIYLFNAIKLQYP